MSGIIDCGYLNRMYRPLPENRTVRSAAARASSFLDMAARAGEKKNGVFEVNGTEATAANVHDVTVAAELPRENDEVVYGDSANLYMLARAGGSLRPA